MPKKVKPAPAPEPVEPAAVWMAPGDLVPWADNPRVIPEEAVEAVAKSIEELGFGAPILARAADKVVIAGHTRLAAAGRLKLERVPVRLLDVDEPTARRLALADNRLGEMTAWDEMGLAAIVAGLADQGVDYTAAGFGEADLAAFRAMLGEPGVPGPEGDGKPFDEDAATGLRPRCRWVLEFPNGHEDGVRRVLDGLKQRVEGLTWEEGTTA